MGSLFCHYLFLISPSFGASGGLYFVIAAFLGIFTSFLFASDIAKSRIAR